MKLEEIIKQIEDLKESLEDEKCLALYASEKHISSHYLKRCLNKDIESLNLHEAFNLLGFYPDDDIPSKVFFSNIGDISELKKFFEKGLL